jgi:hypothetical protein
MNDVQIIGVVAWGLVLGFLVLLGIWRSTQVDRQEFVKNVHDLRHLGTIFLTACGAASLYLVVACVCGAVALWASLAAPTIRNTPLAQLTFGDLAEWLVLAIVGCAATITSLVLLWRIPSGFRMAYNTGLEEWRGRKTRKHSSASFHGTAHL